MEQGGMGGGAWALAWHPSTGNRVIGILVGLVLQSMAGAGGQAGTSRHDGGLQVQRLGDPVTAFAHAHDPDRSAGPPTGPSHIGWR